MITFKVDNLKNMNDCLKPFLEFLRSFGVTDDDVFDSRLVSCELITNVIRHLGETANFEGGVNAENMEEYLACKKVLAVGGSWMTKGTAEQIAQMSRECAEKAEKQR